MSENKHTPEPWCISDHNKSIIKCYQGEQTPHGTTPYFAGGGALESERTANARRIVACINACAGIDTELLEIIEDNDKTLAGVIANVEKQRDELLAALENCRLLAARHRKEEWAGHVLRFCGESGVAGEVMR